MAGTRAELLTFQSDLKLLKHWTFWRSSSMRNDYFMTVPMLAVLNSMTAWRFGPASRISVNTGCEVTLLFAATLKQHVIQNNWKTNWILAPQAIITCEEVEEVIVWSMERNCISVIKRPDKCLLVCDASVCSSSNNANVARPLTVGTYWCVICIVTLLLHSLCSTYVVNFINAAEG
jgi:hypothetical protein